MTLSSPEILESYFSYNFKDKQLLETSLSVLISRNKDFERLEFLGDRVLSLAMAQLLWELFPAESEGDWAKRHASLVSGKILQRLISSPLREFFEDRARHHNKNRLGFSVLEDVMEAIISAIYLDGGFLSALESVRYLYRHELEKHKNTPPPIDAKSALQEWALQRSLDLPEYQVVAKHGEDHKPIFIIAVSIQNREPIIAMGTSKTRAEQAAAGLLLKQLTTST